jgi:TPR repeat protein
VRGESFDFVHADAMFLRGEYRAAFEAYFYAATALQLPRAAFDVAFLYHMGYGVPKNDHMARQFYKASLYLDGGVAAFNLALLHLRGQGGAVDFEAALDMMQRAAAEDCIDAQLYLGLAHTMGCLFDPIETECISMIPYRRVISRSAGILLATHNFDPAADERRYEVIEADAEAAAQMLRRATRHKDDTYIETQLGNANLLLGQALIEGLGDEYDPAKGFRLIKRAAIRHRSREAAAYLAANREKALAYGVDPHKVGRLGRADADED